MSIMKKSIFVLIGLFAVLFLVTPPLDARTVSFGDSAIYWPGHPAVNTADLWGFYDNTTDYIGEPDLKGGKIEINAGVTKVSIEGYGYQFSGQTLSPGDLFISARSDAGQWDFVVPLNIAPAMLASGNGGGTYNVYRLTGGIPVQGGSDFYRITGPDFVDPWPYDDLRNDHPIALATGYLKNGNYEDWGTAVFSGAVNGFTTWEFSKPLTYTGDTIAVGWTVSCANDVIYEKVNVPEPTVLILLGVGLIGVLGAKRKTGADR
jgi:hypothetical protein